MGYESRIFVVRKSTLPSCEEHGKKYAEEIARFDLCKVYGVSDYLRNCKKTDCYIYADDGNTPMLEDRYGGELTECTPAQLLELIEKDVENSRDDWRGGMYWRYKLILPVLRELVELNCDNIVCLHFGY